MKNNAKPFTRLWVYGMAVNKADIEIELKTIKDAGIGGIELQVLYPLFCSTAENTNVDYFSPEFFERLELIVSCAESLDLYVDVTLGSGWPFGGPFITKDMSPDIMLPYEFDIIGPTTFNEDLTGTISGSIIKAILVPFDNHIPNFKKALDVTSKVKKTYITVWPWGEEISDIIIPEGHHKLYIYVNNEYRQQVGKAAPNMNGYVMSHSRQDVTRVFLKNVADPIIEKIGKGRIRSFFCDSIELTGSNWSNIIIEEFYKNKGYDLSPYIPALWEDYGEISEKVRYDFYDVRSELTINNFFNELNMWATNNGTISRVQAHGTWGDIIKAYGVSGIPEGETFGFGDYLDTNIMHRRLAVSAAILYDRDIKSNESYTWLRKPRYQVSLEILKRATDAIFLDGINHIINHGYSFVPSEFKKEELAFYASTVISPDNTWWSHYNLLSKYITNCSKLFQENRIKTNILMYIPQNDIWSQSKIGELHIGKKIEEKLGKKNIRNIDNAGYFTTFINDEKILELTENLEINQYKFDVLILPNIKSMTLPVYEHILKIAQNGARIIFTDNVPQKSLGLYGNSTRIREIRNALENLCLVVDSQRLLETLLCNFPLDVKFTSNGNIGMIRYEGNEDFLFIANVELKKSKFKLEFNKKVDIEVVNPHDLTIINEFNNIDTFINEIDENDSLLIKFTNCRDEKVEELAETKKISKITPKLKDIELHIDHQILHLDELKKWTDIDEFKFFVGEASYRFKVNFDYLTTVNCILLENCFFDAEVYINDKFYGTKWFKKRLEINDNFLGDTVFEIKVTSLKLNKYLEIRKHHESESTIGDQWPYFNSIIDERLNNMCLQWREFDEIEECIPSGLSGPLYFEVLS